MKILPISDIHGNSDILDYIVDNIDIDSYDLVTVSGDVWEGLHIEGKYRWDAFQELIDKPIIMIQGNHDFWTNKAFNGYENIHLLHNDTLEIDGVKFFGTPYTVNFCNWNWMNSEDALFDMWDNTIPSNIDVLLSHGPPYGYSDNCNQSIYDNHSESHLGSKSLLHVLNDKTPKYVFCGHIHTGDRISTMENGTKVYNVSCLDETYQFLGHNPAPKVVELEL